MAHSSPEYSDMSFATFLQCATDVQKMRQVFLSRVLYTISWQAVRTTWSVPIASSTSSATNSPARMCRLERSGFARPDFEVIFEM